MGRIDLPDSATPDVSVLVVLTADAARAATSLRAIAEAAPPVATEVVLVLNGATPDVHGLINEEVRGARLVDAPVDLGLAAAWRQGLQLARARRISLLHEDSFPRAGWLAPLLETLDARPHAGVVGGRLLHPDGRHQNDGWVLWRDAHVSVLSGELAQRDVDPPRPVDYVSSAALLTDRALLAELDLPDESWFPAVYTDSDLSRAVWASGRVVLHDPRSVVSHGKLAMVQPGGPPNRGRHLPAFLNARNRERFLVKWRDELATRPERSEGTWPDSVPPDELGAALALTAERAAAIESGPPPTPPNAVPPAQDATRVTVEDAALERAALRRAELDKEFTTWLSAQLDAAAQEIEALRAHAEAVQHEAERAVAANRRLAAELERLS
jgi:GT2 family glycosyltransferase